MTMRTADAAYKPPNLSAYFIASRIADALERADAAEKRRQQWAADEFRAHANQLRARLARMPCRTPADQAAQLVVARRAAQELVGALAAELAAKGLDERAVELLDMLDRLIGLDDPSPTQGCWRPSR
jgi:hypothetical protein